jgi:NTE family protein
MFNFLKKKKTLGIAFGGGGARGVAHIGIVQVLLENNVDISYCSGTSIGALVGAFVADKRPIEEILKISKNLGYKDLVSVDFNFQGLSNSEKTIGRIVKKYIPHDSFEGLKIPFSVVATNVCKGEPYVIKKGSLSKSVAMSACFPGVFSPVIDNGEEFIDGGIFINLPTKEVKKLGADIVIGINLNPHHNFCCKRKSSLDLLNRSLDLLISNQNIKKADLIVHPLKDYYSLFEMNKKKELLELGRKCAENEILPFLKKKKILN